MANEEVFKRYKNNPIITVDGLKNGHSILNSAVVPFKKAYAGVFRVDNQHWYSELRTGSSTDGIHWKIADDPIQFECRDPEIKNLNRPENSPYDPRVVRIEGTYYLTFCHYPTNGSGPAIGLAATRDFKRFTLIQDILFPFNRNAVLFPRKIKGKYALLHRPSDTGHTPFGEIFYATSPDMIHWGNQRFVFGTAGSWQATKVGPGPAPLETPEGWLLIYHGVKTTCSGLIYCAGGAILDLEKPWNVRYRSRKYLLAPTKLYERVGDVPNVVFPAAMLHDKARGKISVYYGCADTCVGLATADLAELMAFIKANSF